MAKFLFYILLAQSLESRAAERCQAIFAQNPASAAANIFDEKSQALEKAIFTALSKEQRNAEFKKYLFADAKESTVEKPDLRINWRVNYPENPVQVEGASWQLHPHKKITIDYVIDPNNSENPYAAVNRFAGLPRPDMRFFENVYKNYKDRIRDEIVQQVKSVEENLPELRQSYGLVFESNYYQVIGTIRVFDGTPRRLNDVYQPQRAATSPVLPFEAIFKARNIPVQFIQKLEKMREESPYTPVFEIGKLSLEGSPQVNDRALKAIELFLYDYYLKRYPDAIFIVHVASRAHLKLYQKRYGFEIEETVNIPGSDQVEHVLTLPAAKFREALKLRLEL